MVDRMEAELAGFGVELKDAHDLLSLAALIQAEGKHEEDFFKISRVFANRLDKGMLLQSDPTVKYRYEGSSRTSRTGSRMLRTPSTPTSIKVFRLVR